MFQKIAKHRANDASNDVHRPPLGSTPKTSTASTWSLQVLNKTSVHSMSILNIVVFLSGSLLNSAGTFSVSTIYPLYEATFEAAAPLWVDVS